MTALDDLGGSIWIVRLSELPGVSQIVRTLQEHFWRLSSRPLNVVQFASHHPSNEIESLGGDAYENYCEFCQIAIRADACKCRVSRSEVALRLLGTIASEAKSVVYQCPQFLTNVCVPVTAGERVVACLFSGQLLPPNDRRAFGEVVRGLAGQMAPEIHARLLAAVETRLGAEASLVSTSVEEHSRALEDLGKVISGLAEQAFSVHRSKIAAACVARARQITGRLPAVTDRAHLRSALVRFCGELCVARGVARIAICVEGDPPGTLRPAAWWPANLQLQDMAFPFSMLEAFPEHKATVLVQNSRWHEPEERWRPAIAPLTGDSPDCCLVVRSFAGPTKRAAWFFVNRQGLPIEAHHFSQAAIELFEDVVDEAAWGLGYAALVESREQLLTKFAHEVAVPITSIIGNVQILQRSDTTPVRAAMLLEEIVTRCHQAEFLRETVYDLEADETDIDLNLQPTMIMGDIVAPCIDWIKGKARARKRSVHGIRYTGLRVVPQLSLDRNRFEQVVMNLLDNAVKYAQPGTNECDVEVEALHRAGRYWLVFRDRGMGFEESEVEAVFVSGVRGRRAHQVDVTGKGFGLSLARKYVRAHGGELSISNLREPTEISILLPHAPEQEETSV